MGLSGVLNSCWIIVRAVHRARLGGFKWREIAMSCTTFRANPTDNTNSANLLASCWFGFPNLCPISEFIGTLWTDSWFTNTVRGKHTDISLSNMCSTVLAFWHRTWPRFISQEFIVITLLAFTRKWLPCLCCRMKIFNSWTYMLQSL